LAQLALVEGEAKVRNSHIGKHQRKKAEATAYRKHEFSLKLKSRHWLAIMQSTADSTAALSAGRNGFSGLHLYPEVCDEVAPGWMQSHVPPIAEQSELPLAGSHTVGVAGTVAHPEGAQ
jgi:hypothetical protein